MDRNEPKVLTGCSVVVTRPAGTATALAHQIKAMGGMPLLLPGLSLRGAADPDGARVQWQQARQDEVLIFTSPAAVRHAAALAPLNDIRGQAVAVGQSTAGVLRKHGIAAEVPRARQDSEGVLALPALQQVQGVRIALITAPGGRGLLQQQLLARGAQLREVHVYRRVAARLTRRHVDAVLHMPDRACVLLSSAEALQNLESQLPPVAWQRLCRAVAIVSSERIEEAARAAGFAQVHRARSAAQADLLTAARAACGMPR